MLVHTRLPRWRTPPGYDWQFSQDRFGLFVAAPRRAIRGGRVRSWSPRTRNEPMSSSEERPKSENVRRVRRAGSPPLRFTRSHLRTFTPASILAGIVVLAVLGWIAVAIWGDRQRAWGILLTDFLFLSCLAAGLVVWPADRGGLPRPVDGLDAEHGPCRACSCCRCAS